LLHDISDRVTQAGANVRFICGDVSSQKQIAKIRLSLDIASADQVARVLDKLEQNRDVVSVRRVGKNR
jgi:(p)ppGpp synthase/HD superfamily hydrolase